EGRTSAFAPTEGTGPSRAARRSRLPARGRPPPARRTALSPACAPTDAARAAVLGASARYSALLSYARPPPPVGVTRAARAVPAQAHGWEPAPDGPPAPRSRPQPGASLPRPAQRDAHTGSETPRGAPCP